MSKKAQTQEVISYLFFQSIELAVHCYLLVTITNLVPIRLRAHKDVLDEIKKRALTDIAMKEVGELYEKLLESRGSIYKEVQPHHITMKDIKLVKKFINHIKIIMAYQ